MRVNELCTNGDEVTITLSVGELNIVRASISEAIEALDEWDFPIRVGYEVEEAKHLHASLSAVLQSLSPGT